MIPPECFPRAKELLRTIPPCDFHVHTTFSDGENTLQEYAQQAQKLGIQQLAFSDHIRKGSTWFPQFVEELHQVQGENPDICLYRAAEAKLTDTNELDIDREVLQQLDFVIGVVHRYPDFINGGYISPAKLPPEQAFRLDVESTYRLLDIREVQVIGHLGGIYYHYFHPYPWETYQEIIRCIKEKNKILEINPKYIADMKQFLKICCDVNPRVSLGSDAHSIKELGAARQAVQEALWKE